MDDLTKFTESQQKKILKSLVVLVDTREKKFSHVTNWFDTQGVPWERRKLDQGDYSIKLPANPDLGIDEDIYFDKLVMLERKAGLSEISGNLTKDRARIEKEFANAPPHKVLLIEGSSFNDLIMGNYKTDLKPNAFVASLFSIWHRFGLPVVFLEGHDNTGQFIYKYLYYFLYNKLKGRV